MPRAVWSGSIAFVLVNVPVALQRVQEGRCGFHLADRETGSPIGQEK